MAAGAACLRALVHQLAVASSSGAIAEDRRDGPTVFVGIDRAEAHHDVCVLDPEGSRLDKLGTWGI